MPTGAVVSAFPLITLEGGTGGAARVSAASLLVLTDQRPPSSVSAFSLLVLMPAPSPAEATFEDGATSHPLTWTEVTERDGGVLALAEVDLNDAASYYHGYKAPRILEFSKISQGLSDKSGSVEHMTFGWLASDISREFRGLLDDVINKHLTNRPILERMIDDEMRRVEGLPRLVACGFISSYSPMPDLQFRVNATDWLKRKFTRKRASQNAWQPRVSRADFSTLPQASINLPAPLPYGKVSDELLDVADTTPADRYPIAAVDPGWLGLGYNHVAAGAIPAGTSYVSYVTTITGGVESSVIPFQVGYDLDGTQQPAIYFKTTALPDFYRVYYADGRDAFHPITNPSGAPLTTFARYQDFAPGAVPEGPTDPFGNPTDLRYVVITSTTWGSDFLALITGSSSGDVIVEAPRGQAPVLHVGSETINGESWSAFVVARGAIADIPGVFVNGVRQTSFGLATSLLVPFHTDYVTQFGTNYRDINSKRWTMLYARGTVALNAISGDAKITLNVWGAEDVGDCSGTVITRLPLQYRHFAKSWLAPDTAYAAGAWPASTFFEAEPTLSLIDDDSFDTLDDGAEERLPGGYEGAFIIGANGEEVGALEQVARFNISCDCDSGFNRKGQFLVSLEPLATPEDAARISDVLNVIDHTLGIEELVESEFFNITPYKHTRDYAGWIESGWRSIDLEELEVVDQESIDLYEQEMSAASADLHCLSNRTAQGAATIVDVLARKRVRFRDPRRRVTLQLPFSGLGHEIGDVVQLTTIEGISADGWTDRPLRVTRKETEPTAGTVLLDCYDLGILFGGGFILGDEDVRAALWPDGDALDHIYGYLCDEATGLFSNGYPGKRLR